MTTHGSGLGLFWQNVASLPAAVRESFSRRSAPTSDRARSQSVFANMFLHIHSTRVHPHALRLTYTWGLGVASAALFFILTVTGVLLMIYYSLRRPNRAVYTQYPSLGGTANGHHRHSPHGASVLYRIVHEAA
jgi:hypothetical protein